MGSTPASSDPTRRVTRRSIIRNSSADDDAGDRDGSVVRMPRIRVEPREKDDRGPRSRPSVDRPPSTRRLSLTNRCSQIAKRISHGAETGEGSVTVMHHLLFSDLFLIHQALSLWHEAVVQMLGGASGAESSLLMMTRMGRAATNPKLTRAASTKAVRRRSSAGTLSFERISEGLSQLGDEVAVQARAFSKSKSVWRFLPWILGGGLLVGSNLLALWTAIMVFYECDNLVGKQKNVN